MADSESSPYNPRPSSPRAPCGRPDRTRHFADGRFTPDSPTSPSATSRPPGEQRADPRRRQRRRAGRRDGRCPGRDGGRADDRPTRLRRARGDGPRAAARASDRRAELLELAQEDADAYDVVVRARHLPKDSEAERAARTAALAGGDARGRAHPAPDRGGRRGGARPGASGSRRSATGTRSATPESPPSWPPPACAARCSTSASTCPTCAADEPLRASAPAEIARLEALAAERASRRRWRPWMPRLVAA